MSQNEVKKCPQCGGIMTIVVLSTKEKLRRKRTWADAWDAMSWWMGFWKRRFLCDKIIPFCCKSCGYIELYKEKKE